MAMSWPSREGIGRELPPLVDFEVSPRHALSMQVTMDIEPDLWEAARKKAEADHMSVEQALNQLLRRFLTTQAPSRREGSFTFSVPGGRVSAADVRAAVEDDDE